MDLWDEIIEPPKKPGEKEKRQTSALDDDFELSMTGVSSNQRRSSVTRSRGRKNRIFPAILVLATVCLALVLFFSDRIIPSPEGFDPVLEQEPVWLPDADTFPVAPTVPTVTDPPAVTDPPTPSLNPDPVPESTEAPVQAKTYRFYGQRLSYYEQQIYDQIAEGIGNFETSIPNICLISVDDLEPILEALFYDYAEYFWYTGAYTYSYRTYDNYCELTFTPEYFWDVQTCRSYASYVHQTTDAIIAPLQGKSDYEKVRYIYEYLIDNTAYDPAYMGKTLFELLSEGRAVCAAYARATQYMLTKLGMEVIYVVGDAGTPGDLESHAWNIINVGGDYYQYDATWGDPYYEDGTQEKNFYYLCITDRESNKTHFPYDNIYPSCTATRYNYYTYEGFYLEFYNTDTILQWLAEANQGEPILEFKCANELVYREVINNLITNGGFFDLFQQVANGINNYTYSTDDNFLIVKLTW